MSDPRTPIDLNPYGSPAGPDVPPPLPPLHQQGFWQRMRLPFSKWWPLLAGALAGVALRLLFMGDPGNAMSAMSGGFIYGSPLLVGAITVYVAERRAPRSWSYYFFAPLIANVLYVLGTLAINIEGWICAILIVPMFSIIGAIGGLLMGVICRSTGWPKQATLSLAVLPLLFGALEPQLPRPERLGDLQRSVVIAAPPAQVWQQILHADNIRAEEVDRGWMYRIGVPTPQAGVIEQTADGPVRRITMGKGIHFDQVVAAWQPERHVDFTYRFAPDSFPPRALDDHVRIGGSYFDLRNTAYTLTPVAEGTRLTVRMRYRVSTSFNWYARPLAQWLIGDFEDTVLQFYRHRSEAAQQADTASTSAGGRVMPTAAIATRDDGRTTGTTAAVAASPMQR